MKNNITREELKKIHDIACDTWKPKLAKYAQEDPFSETIKFTEKQINEMIKACTDVQLPVVKEIFDVRDSWEDIKTVEDATNKLGEKDEDVIQLRKLESVDGLADYILNNQIAIVVAKALNDGWVANWDDHNEYKYYPWFYLGKNFRCNSCNGWNSNSDASSRLSLKSSELAIYAGKQFKDVYEKFMN